MSDAIFWILVSAVLSYAVHQIFHTHGPLVK
jgi:hypothetical protein